MSDNQSFTIDPELKKDIAVFERFSHQLGFKRIEGSLYGLLVLSERALSSEEIQAVLELSQSAVSQGLKSLATFGAVETFEDRERRCKVHSAKEDSLSIAATVFRKREQQDILDFKEDIKRILSNTVTGKDDPRYRRLSSIISTCEIAEAVTNFVVSLSQMQVHKNYERLKKLLPQVLEIIGDQNGPFNQFTTQLKANLSERMKKAPLPFSLAPGFLERLSKTGDSL